MNKEAFVQNVQLKSGVNPGVKQSMCPAAAPKMTLSVGKHSLGGARMAADVRGVQTPAMTLSNDVAASSIKQNAYAKFGSSSNFNRVQASARLVNAPQMRTPANQGPSNLQMAVQNKQIGSKVAVGAGFMAAAIALFNPAPAVAGDIAAGEKVFEANCAACHKGGQNVVQPEKTLVKEALEKYLSGGFKEASIVTQATNGKNAMPAFGGKLSGEEIANVAAYVYDQAENDKWE